MIISLLSACGGQASSSNTDYFIPPTLAAERQAISLASPTSPPPTAKPDCTNDLTFIADVTVEDGSIFLPKADIKKVWRVKNSGTCNWEAGYLFQLVSGEALGAEKVQALYPARSGSEIEIAIEFTAPVASGDYQTMWQAFTPDGEAFGEPVYMLIKVDPDYVTDTPAPTAGVTTGTPSSSTTPDVTQEIESEEE